MGLARVQDVLVKTSTPTSKFVCLSLAAGALGMGISWPSVANAQVVDAPPHRIEFTVSPGLPKCSNYDEFYAILVNFVRVRSIDPTAKRKLIVNIERLPDGRKREFLSVLDANGVELATEAHRYPATEECFKVLYWAAFDAAKLLKLTVPPPVEEAPMSVDKLVAESEKPDRVQEKQRASTSSTPNTPIYDAEFYSKPAREQCEVREEPRLPGHIVFGVGATIGLTRMVMPGLRLGVGRTVGPVMVELDVRAFPPLITANWDTETGQQQSARAHAYLGSFAACAQKKPLFGCAVVTGGVSQYVYDQPVLDNERYVSAKVGGVFLLGMRAGFALSLSPRWDLRFDVEGSFPIYMSDALRVPQRFGRGENVSPAWSGFVSVVPSF